MSFILKKLDSINGSPSKEEEDVTMLSKDSDVNGLDRAGGKNDSLLSTDASFNGSISFKTFLRIDGQFEGEIKSKGTLFVGKTGVVKADIKVGNIIVEGKIHGNVQAQEKIDLRQSAQLFGDIKANKLIIAEGVSFVGNCDVNPTNEKIDSADNAQSKPKEDTEKKDNKQVK